MNEAGINLSLVVASQGIFLAFMLLLKKRLHKGGLLAAYFGSFSLIILSWILVWAQVRINYYPVAIHTPFQYLLGPLLLLYIRRNGKAERKYELFLPALVTGVYCFYWIGIIFQFGFTQHPEVLVPTLVWLNRLSMLSMLVYLVRLVRYEWSGHKIFLLVSLAVFLGGNVLYQVLWAMGVMTQAIDYWLVGFIFVIFYLTGYLYLVKSGQSSSAQSSDPEAEEVLERIIEFFQNEPQYLKKGYRIEELAVQLGEPVSQVSKSIKQVGQSNFKDFINRYRIEHAKRLLVNSDLKIEAITMESGFSNKVSFIENFKKMEGVRPTEYRKNADFGKVNRLD